MQSRRVVAAAVVVLALIACAFFWLQEKPDRRKTAPPVVAVPSSAAEVPGAGGPRAAPSSSSHGLQTVNAQGLEPGAASATPEQRFLARMDETRLALLAKRKYPAMSQPLATKTDQLLPHYVDPMMRMLGGIVDPNAPPGTPPQPGRVKILQKQDRVYLMPGQSGIASFQAMLLDGGPAPVNITRSDIVREAAPDRPLAVVGHSTFHDDGVAPDDLAGDGTWTATVTPPDDGVASGLMLYVDIDSGGEHGTLSFPFIQSASPPGKFTHTARCALEEGSVAFYVGVQLDRAGTYEILARVYDSTGAPVAYLRFYDPLATGAGEVRMVAYGSLLVDEGAVPPLVLRDVEGHRMTFDQFPDREIMDDWAGGFATPKYDVSQFTTKPYTDPTKQDQLNALNKATADGVSNLRGQGAGAAAGPPPGSPSPQGSAP